MSRLTLLGDLLAPRDSGICVGWRPLPRSEERAATELAMPSQAAQSLSEHIPGSLMPAHKRVAALVVGGAPAWSRRLRRIDTLTDNAVGSLETAWRALARARRGKPAQFAAEWREHAAGANFAVLNDLIRRHNEHFPAEANLAMDVRTGDYIGLGGGDYRRQPLDLAWVLARFPPDLLLALD
jgi:hypothetical protein